jgi:hypothetical protein
MRHALQETLGHSTLEMTRQYANLARRDVAEQHKKFSPMEALLNPKNASRPVPGISECAPAGVLVERSAN